MNNLIASLFFDNHKIQIGSKAAGITVPNAPVNFGHSFIQAEVTASGEDVSLILIKDSIIPHQWIAYSQKDNKFLRNSTGNVDARSTPTLMDKQLVFIMNNPTGSVWGIYKYDFSSGGYGIITNIYGLTVNTIIVHTEYLSDPQYLLMWDKTGFLWVVDCANNYELLTKTDQDVIWKDGSYPIDFKPSSPSFIVSDGRSNVAIFNIGYHKFLTAHFI